jgi:hypothetical protein
MNQMSKDKLRENRLVFEVLGCQASSRKGLRGLDVWSSLLKIGSQTSNFQLRQLNCTMVRMKFFASNIGRRGRLARAALGGVLVVVGIALAWVAWWACVVFLVAGGFTLFEAARGWCLLRACGIKTRV